MEHYAALHMDTVRLHEMAPVRTHSDLIRSFHSGLAELVSGGVLVFQNRQWLHAGKVVAMYEDYTDSQNRSRVCIRFGSWLCLALALKVSRPETRQALLDVLKKHPLI